MSVTFTNNWDNVLNKLESIVKTEFKSTLKTYRGLGNVMGQLGQRYGGLTAGDLNALYSAGTSRQNYNQAVLDAYRSNQMNPLKGALMPLTLGQQFLKGTPSVGNVQQYTQTYQPSPNPFLQGLGLSFAYGQPQGQPQA